MSHYEVNFDGLIGPSHNYSGLGTGNLASHRHMHQTSHPKQAALQGLDKMQMLVDWGYTQGFFPPQQRPDIAQLRQLGFTGTDRTILCKVAAHHSDLLSLVYSASNMWTANAATVTPSTDSGDGRVHFTPANMIKTHHRTIESEATAHCLCTIFSDVRSFHIHPPLPAQLLFADEGAANHLRLATHHGVRGVNVFVYGQSRQTDTSNWLFPARQDLYASQAVSRRHSIEHALFLCQSPEVIHSGAFHNDVVACGNGPVLFFHEMAFTNESQQRVFEQLHERLAFMPICVPSQRISVTKAVNSYLFNSQLLSSPQGDMTEMRLVAPSECDEDPDVRQYLDELVSDASQPIRQIQFVNVRQSMHNGGGPACLRLRVVLSSAELQRVNSAFIVHNDTLDVLRNWVKRHYRDTLTLNDLRDPDFCDECRTALDDLTQLLGIGAYYPFQADA